MHVGQGCRSLRLGIVAEIDRLGVFAAAKRIFGFNRTVVFVFVFVFDAFRSSCLRTNACDGLSGDRHSCGRFCGGRIGGFLGSGLPFSAGVSRKGVVGGWRVLVFAHLDPVAECVRAGSRSGPKLQTVVSLSPPCESTLGSRLLF
jgi:hypothetical protein